MRIAEGFAARGADWLWKYRGGKRDRERDKEGEEMCSGNGNGKKVPRKRSNMEKISRATLQI